MWRKVSLVHPSCCSSHPARLAFSVTILDRLLGKHPDASIGVLYDIGCNLAAHVGKRGFFHEERQAGRLSFGCSIFHAFAHSWICQLQYNPSLIRGYGLSNGEGMERLWSALSCLIPSLRVSTKTHRQYAIDAFVHQYNRSKLYGLGALLLRQQSSSPNTSTAAFLSSMAYRLEKRMEAAAAQLETVTQRGATYSEQDLRTAWADQVKTQLDPTKASIGPDTLLTAKQKLQSAWLKLQADIKHFLQVLPHVGARD
jgi:hypothetical protein